MTFILEAVFAKKGDALILHCGDSQDPHWILIDGGTGVWGEFLEPRLNEIRTQRNLNQLPLDMVMVSHIDQDHIQGILSLMHSVARDASPKFEVETLWHNAFDKLSKTTMEEIVGILKVAPVGEEGGVASVNQGVELSGLAEDAIQAGRLTSLNGFFSGVEGFPALVVANEQNTTPFAVGETGVNFTVLAPNTKRLAEYQEAWDKKLEEARKEKEKKQQEGADPAGAAASLVAILDPNDAFTFEDDSPYNLASIVVLAERDGATMLLTGDATGADIVEGLVLAGHLPEEALLDKAGLQADRERAAGRTPAADPAREVHTFHVTLLKVPHHGSPNNVTTGFFRRVTADDYVISGDGDHGNPNTDMLEMLLEARGDEPFTIHFTLSESQIESHADVKGKKKREGLERLAGWLEAFRDAGLTNPKLVFRRDDKKSVAVNPQAAH